MCDCLFTRVIISDTLILIYFSNCWSILQVESTFHFMFWLNLRFSGTILEHSFHKLFFIQLIFNFCHCWRLHIKIFVIITKPSTMAMFKLRWVKEVLQFLLPHMFHSEVGLSAICMCLQYILRKSVKHLWYFQYVLRKYLQEERKLANAIQVHQDCHTQWS